MGYRTNYDLKVRPDGKTLPEIFHELRAPARKGKYSFDLDYMAHAFDEEGNTQEPCTWYCHEEDMRKT
jgi:hypothetical protein